MDANRIKFVKTPISNITFSKALGLVAFNLNNILYVFNTQTSSFISIDSNHQHKDLIRSIEFAHDNSFLVTSSGDKTIKVWNTKDLTCLKTIDTSKKIKISKIVNNNQSVVLSDKEGDVYIYHLNDSAEKVKKEKEVEEGDEVNLLLGHFSAITDMIFSPCFKYILTSDRDEKIRVSKFPNSFDIESFCLGHTQFVSKMIINNDICVSGSGDGSIKVWNFKKGELLQSIDCKLIEPELGDRITVVPTYIDNQHVFVSIEETPVLLAYNIVDGKLSESPKKIQLTSPPTNCTLLDDETLILSLMTDKADSQLLTAIDIKQLVVKQSTLVDSINQQSSTLTTSTPTETELKTLGEQILKSQFRKFIGMCDKKYQKKFGENKDGSAITHDDSNSSEPINETKQDKTPLKLRKMTVEGAKEQTK